MKLAVFGVGGREGRDDYRCFDFLFDRLAGAVDSVASASKGDFSLGVVLVELGGDVDSAAC